LPLSLGGHLDGPLLALRQGGEILS
ncbi:hypothetical protein LCGC14_2971000, partial [marine sediment metagenome]